MKTKNRMLSICALACMLPVTVQAAETAPAVDETSNMVQTADVNVTAQGYEKPTLDTPADATVYTADELKKTGAHDVISALKYKNGVHFTQMGPDNQSWITGNAGVNLRGIENGTLVLIDGIPASFNNVSHLDMLTLDTVDRVEVVKGGGSVLYGSEAFGGVVNVITKSAYKNMVRIAAGPRAARLCGNIWPGPRRACRQSNTVRRDGDFVNRTGEDKDQRDTDPVCVWIWRKPQGSRSLDI